MNTNEQIEKQLNAMPWGNIPSHTADTLRRYVGYGVPTGGFLHAVLTNRLFESFSRADSTNQLALKEIVNFVYNYVPSNCWGDDGIVETWLNNNGLEVYCKVEA